MSIQVDTPSPRAAPLLDLSTIVLTQVFVRQRNPPPRRREWWNVAFRPAFCSRYSLQIPELAGTSAPRPVRFEGVAFLPERAAVAASVGVDRCGVRGSVRTRLSEWGKGRMRSRW